MNHLSKLFVLLALAGTFAACQNNDDNNPQPPPSADMVPDTITDAQADVPDSQDDSADVTGPVVPEACKALPACDRGESFDESCQCRGSMDRRCETDAQCRDSETCVERTVDEKTRKFCFFDDSTLSVVKCPGAPGCAAGADTPLMAAARSMSITPLGFEVPGPQGLNDDGTMNFAPNRPFSEQKWLDCGFDGLCPGDDGYTQPDEGEADGKLQGAWIAGFGHGRPAQYCPAELIGCDGPECCVSKLAHDDLKAQIVVMKQGDVSVAFVALDAVGLFRTEMEFIRKALKTQTDVDLVVIGSTHSHEGFDTVGQWGPGTALPLETGVSPVFMQRIRDQIVQGVTEAMESLRPAKARVAVIDAGVDGLAISDSRPPYIFDDNIPVVHLTDAADDTTIATMLSMGNHAEALGSRNPYLSADFFHFSRKYIEQGLEAVDTPEVTKPALAGLGGVTVMFAGAVGGLINPLRGRGKTYAGELIMDRGYVLADAIGQSVAQRVLSAVSEERVNELPEQAPLRFATRQFLTPISNNNFKVAGWSLKVFRREVYNATKTGLTSFFPAEPMVMSEVAVVRLGELTFFTAPGEAFPELLVGGYPNQARSQAPVIGDVEGVRVGLICDELGLPVEGNLGTFPCIVKPDQENPPNWAATPSAPYVYDLIPGQYPFFIGLGMDFLGYMVPAYDYQLTSQGNHYEETNGASAQLAQDWTDALKLSIQALDE